MGEYLLHIPRVSDKTLYNCMREIASDYSSNNVVVNLNIVGDISLNKISLESDHLPEELVKVLECNSKLINSISLNINQFVISFSRGGFDPKKSPVYDEIKISGNNTELDAKHRIEIISKISTQLKSFDPSKEPGGLLSEEQQNQLDIHISTIKQLETLNSDLAKQITTDLYESSQKLQKEFSERQDKLSQQITDERAKLTDEFNEREENLREKRKALEERENAIDLRDNTIVRRELRNTFLDVIKERTSKFQLTSDTRRLRIPIHLVCCLIIGISTFASFVFAKEFLVILSSKSEIATHLIWQLSIKQIAFAAIAGSTFIFYIKWMNRWFERHSQAEFHLKQLQLDFERANWVVETSLEWKKELKEAVIPAELLRCLTNNLFTSGVREEDYQNLHPSDQVISALLGNATNVKLKAGNADIELTGKGIQKAEKSLK